MKKKRRGFTLIELMVVVGIIALLATALLATLSEPRKRGRDARREADMKQIKNALEFYNSDENTYPDCGSTAIHINGSDCLSLALVPSYIPSAPLDPLNSGSTCGDAGSFIYCYKTLSGGSSYEVSYQLETNAVQGKPAGWWTESP